MITGLSSRRVFRRWAEWRAGPYDPRKRVYYLPAAVL